jgi:hypothetical protein
MASRRREDLSRPGRQTGSTGSELSAQKVVVRTRVGSSSARAMSRKARRTAGELGRGVRRLQWAFGQ